ncbi:MAG: DUF4149 domain-containing protein [Gemmatimonadetes bacterium]|nr:DUF4149 domain-containing protein [Gemmatimonadota bacterium]
MKPLGSLLLAAWLGAALLFAASVAPAAFAVLPARALAGALVGRILPVVFVAGMGTAVLAFALDRPLGRDIPARVRAGALAVVAIACGVAQFVIAPRIGALRAEMGPVIEALAVDDPRRRAFGQLHAISVAWLGLAMLAAALAVGAAAWSGRRSAVPSAP